ncbi:MAG: Lrp/AsnC family transcriptional regulator [Candidatus Omnitrophica bacterium]|nr:Lrp/AsnC family transcriptional regulator [Candidatus Omnitrophota bacterium]
MKITDKHIISIVSAQVGIVSRPFKSCAVELGTREEAVVGFLRELKNAGVIRRFGAVLNHYSLGLRTNALVAWKIDADHIDAAAQKLLLFSSISHCYWRKKARHWPYSLYTMVHAKNKKECLFIIGNAARAIGNPEYRVLFTVKELKKRKADIPALLSRKVFKKG